MISIPNTLTGVLTYVRVFGGEGLGERILFVRVSHPRAHHSHLTQECEGRAAHPRGPAFQTGFLIGTAFLM